VAFGTGCTTLAETLPAFHKYLFFSDLRMIVGFAGKMPNNCAPLQCTDPV
jgi:hypothetical protein